MVQRASRAWGRTIMLLGVLAVTPDSLCVRFLVEAGTSPFCILAWKMLFVSGLTGLYAIVQCGGPRELLAGLAPGRYHIPPAIVLQAVTDIGFTLALVYTSAANTLLFLSLNPLWAALLGFFVLRERLPRATVAALAVSVCAILLIFVPSIAHGRAEAQSHGGSSLLGDGIALATGVCLATYITTIRHAGQHAPKANMTAASSLGGLLAAVVNAAAAAGSGGILPRAGGFDPGRPLWQFWCVVAADALCLSALFVAVSLAPALISGPEVGLIMLLEVILGPLWVGLAYGDVPPWWTLVGGSLLLLTLFTHEAVGMLGGGSNGGGGDNPLTSAAGGAVKDGDASGAATEDTEGGNEQVGEGEAPDAGPRAWPECGA